MLGKFRLYIAMSRLASLTFLVVKSEYNGNTGVIVANAQAPCSYRQCLEMALGHTYLIILLLYMLSTFLHNPILPHVDINYHLISPILDISHHLLVTDVNNT